MTLRALRRASHDEAAREAVLAPRVVARTVEYPAPQLVGCKGPSPLFSWYFFPFSICVRYLLYRQYCLTVHENRM